jgi:hypothetical protein
MAGSIKYDNHSPVWHRQKFYPTSKKIRTKKARGVTQAIEHMFRRVKETVNSNPSATKTSKQKNSKQEKMNEKQLT